MTTSPRRKRPASTSTPRRSSRARRPRIQKKDDEEEEEAFVPKDDDDSPATSQKQPPKGKKESFSCPKCHKSFTSSFGLKYHVDKRVCEKRASNSSAQKASKTDKKNKNRPPAKRKRTDENDSSSDDDDEEDAPSKNVDSEAIVTSRTCPHCNKVFSAQSRRDAHVKNAVCQSTNSKKKKKKSQTSRGPEENRTCPTCKRVFSSSMGLSYHLEKRVCADKIKEETPFYTLTAGERFTTSLGIVEVVEDSRAVPTAEVPEDLPARLKRWNAARNKRDQQAVKYYTARGVQSLTRRSLLNELYEKKQLTQASVFAVYHGKDPRAFRDSERRRGIASASDPLWPDPSVPEDSYPDRPVLCKIIPDRRKRVTFQEDGTEETVHVGNTQDISETRLYLRRRLFKDRYNAKLSLYQCPLCGFDFESLTGYKYHAKSQVCINSKKKARESAEGRQATIQRRTDTVLARHQLAMKPSFSHSETIVVDEEEGQQQPAMGSIQAIAEEMNAKPASKKKPSLSTMKKARKDPSIYPQVLISMGFKLLAKEEKPVTLSAFRPKGASRKFNSQAADDTKNTKTSTSDQKEGGSATKNQSLALNGKIGNLPISPDIILLKLKWQLKFEQSRFMGPVYPSVFRALKFKKPLSANALKRKRQRETTLILERKEALKKKLKQEKKEQAELDRARQKEVEKELLEKKEYERLMKELERREQEKKATARAAAKAAKKKRRLRKSKSAIPQKPLPPLVDVRVLVGEINAGRYPSMKPLGRAVRRPKKCSICKAKRKLPILNCTYCAQVFHWKCALSRFTMKNPEPGDVLMCPRCIGLIQSRRVRAEKRRMEKHDSDGCAWTGLDDQEVAVDSMKLSTSLIQGREYECVAAQARHVKELTVLMQDTQTRLSNSLERGRINSVRRAMIGSFESKALF